MDKWLMDSNKLLWHPDRLKDFQDGKRIMPILIDIGIHKGCNIKCVYCYGIKQTRGMAYIPEDRLLMMAEDAKEVGIKAIAIIGDGEPLMNKGLYPFVKKLKRLKIDCGVATNGLLLDFDKLTTLTSSCTWLRFNISGVDKYEKIMGAPLGSFKRFEVIIKDAVYYKSKCTIGLQAVLIPDGFSEIIHLTEKAIEWGVDYLVIKQFSDGGEGMPMHFDMDDYDKATKDLKIAESMTTDKTQIIVKWEAMKDSRNITKNKKWEFDRCLDLPFLFQISGDGGCYPCGFLFGNKDYCYGNIKEERLIDILYSKKYWDIIKTIAKTPLDKLCKGQCRHCKINKFIWDYLHKPEHINFI